MSAGGAMKNRRIHIMGASGSGATTLGRALADALAVPHHDADDYFWLPTVPPYRTTRDVAGRLRLMHEVFVPRADWVLSGSLGGLGRLFDSEFRSRDLPRDPARGTPAAPACPRDRALLRRRGGTRRLAPRGNGRVHRVGFALRSRRSRGSSLARHQAWLAQLPCPGLASRWIAAVV